ncbi:MAG: aminotransferase class V-fold PLP-dependent enzyme [Balneolia bacterium]|nr:aminotransferase class V-fold PLP-dependent enzyme [Balneolia bacterium]
MPSSTTSFNPAAYRDLFPHTQNDGVYLNHASLSPLPSTVIEAVAKSLQRRQNGAVDHFETEFPLIEETRRLISRLIGAEGGHQIAFTPNTSFALNIIAQGLELRQGDEILIYEREFPSNVYPWLQLRTNGVEVSYLPDDNGIITTESVSRNLKPETKVLAISAVQFLSGFRADLQEISRLCKANGTYLVVDAIQSLGHCPVDVCDIGIDALCAGGHKWLMCPQGIGFMYMSDEFRDRLKVKNKGWLSVESIWDLFDTSQPVNPEMKRFEPGTFNIPAIMGMRQSVKLLLEIGPAAINSHTLNLNSYIISELTNAGLLLYGTQEDKFRSAVVSFVLPEHIDSNLLAEQLKEERIYVSSRSGLIRLSPYFYTLEDEIKRAVAVIKQFIK